MKRRPTLVELLASAGCRFEFTGGVFHILRVEKAERILKRHYCRKEWFYLEGENGESWILVTRNDMFQQTQGSYRN